MWDSGILHKAHPSPLLLRKRPDDSGGGVVLRQQSRGGLTRPKKSLQFNCCF